MPTGFSMGPGLKRMQNTLLVTGRKVSRNAVAVMIDHPVLSSFLVALGVRVVFVALSGLFHEGLLIPDEGQYLTLATMASEGKLTSEFWPGYGQSLFASARTLMWPLTALFWVFGPFRIVGQVLVAVFGAATAAASAGLAGRFLRRPFALVAGLTVALFPSQILWSSVVMRESLIWAGLAAMALVVGYSKQSDSRSRIILSAILLGLLFVVMVWLRVQTAVLALWCLFPALLFGSGRRAVRILSAICLFVVAPWLVGMGPGTATFSDNATSILGSSRAYMSVAADSSILNNGGPVAVPTTGPVAVPTTGPVAVVFQSSVSGTCIDRVRQELGEASRISDVSGSLLDRERKGWLCISDGLGGAILVDNRLRTSLSRIPRGLFDTMLRPFLWESAWSNRDKFGAGLESSLWIMLYGFSIYGAWKQREHIAPMVFPVLLVGAIALSGAVTHGNLGTSFRHRGQMLFALAVLSAGGLQAIADRREGKRKGQAAVGSPGAVR